MNNTLVALLIVLLVVGLSVVGLTYYSNNPQSVVNQEVKKQVDSTVLVESIKDYYIPSQSNYNKASFYFVNLNTGKREPFLKSAIYYVNKNNECYDIINKVMQMFKGQYVTSTVSIKTVQITTTEVKMIKEVVTSVAANSNQNYEPPRVILKMPTAGQIATWNIPESPQEDGANFTASWTTLTVDGVNKKAIKVVKEFIGEAAIICKHSKDVTYYVRGIGLMKHEFEHGIEEGGNTISAMDRFDGLSYESESSR